MLLPLGIVTDMRLAVETMVGHVTRSGVVGGLIGIPGDAGEVQPVQHLAGIVPLDEIGRSGDESVSYKRRDIELQCSVQDVCADELIYLSARPGERRLYSAH